MEECTGDIKEWFTENYFKRNVFVLLFGASRSIYTYRQVSNIRRTLVGN